MLGELCQPTGPGPELFHKFLMNVNASVEMSKSNRRKQSKPNRLFADAEGATTPKLNISSPQAQLEPIASPTKLSEEDVINVSEVVDAKDPMDLSTKGLSSTDSQSPKDVGGSEIPAREARSPRSTPMEMVNFPCHTCGDMFPSRAQQEQHISERHSRDSPSKMKSSPGDSMFPTAYHQLATELGINPGVNMLSTKPIPESIKTHKMSPSSSSSSSAVPSMGTPGVGGKGSAGTVFQREAYCEICQREFCNKYFLKTHKANIHGIVDPSDPKAVAAMVKANQSPKVNNISPKVEATPMMPQLHQPQLQHLQPPQQPMLPQQHQKASSQNSSGQKTSPNETMEDFCEICQKHFCNKYYLKKHKMDVHNIRPDGSKSQSGSENLMDSRAGLTQGAPPSSNAAGMPHLPMMMPSMNNLNYNSMNNMLFVNPFVPNMAAMSMLPPMMQPQFLMPGMSNLAAAHTTSPALSSNVSPESKSEQKQLLPVSNLERGESVSDGDKNEAFCNICRKEFCNSYFLQIHKANKHGIFNDVAASAALMLSMAGQAGSVLDSKDFQNDGQSMKIENMSTSPASSTASNSIRPVVLKSDKERNQTSPAFSMQSRLEPAQSMLPTSLSFDAMLAAKQADRIMCDICNKEVCNKYFLKAHKLKMHGIGPTDDKMTTPNKESKADGDSHHAAMPPLIHKATQQSANGQLKSQPAKAIPRNEPENLAFESQPSEKQQQHSALNSQAPSPTASEIQDLVKFGVDPTTYCFPCKQDFGGKYSLKAHKMNIHGLKVDESFQTQRTTSATTSAPLNNISPKSGDASAYMAGDTFQWKWKSATQGKTPSMMPIFDGPASNGSGDHFTWKWKEPANATRVFCDICNKELCNKYFLRTHKLNKHGIRDAIDGSPGKVAEPGMLASSVMADLARASQTSQLSRRSTGNGTQHQSSFHTTSSTSPTELAQQAPFADDVCQICGIVFPNSLAVGEHMKSEHGDENFEETKPKLSKELGKRVFHCQQCPYNTHLWENMQSHQMRKHDVDTNTCPTCQVSFSHIDMLLKHMSEIHNTNVSLDESQGIKRKQQKFPAKNSRSSYKEKLTLGIKAYRMNEKARKISHSRIYACDKCNYTCSSMRNLRFHQAMKHKKKTVVDIARKQTNGLPPAPANTIIQEFKVSSLSGAELALAQPTISLPVHQRIPEDATIHITLVPSKLS